jgi:hypothetical protein
MLLDGVEPEDYIFLVLHDQMGLVNKSLEHLLSFSELHIEKLPDGHTQTRKELLDVQEARESVTADKKSFNETDKVRLDTLKMSLKRNPLQDSRPEIKDEISQLQAEKEQLDKEEKAAKDREKKTKEAYKEMRKGRGRPEDSFAYQLDDAIKEAGGKMQGWHGGQRMQKSSLK